MKLWVALFATIWLVLLEFLLEMIPIAPTLQSYLHVVLGVAIVAVAYANYRGLKATRVPGRVKRTAQATYGLSYVMLLTGVPLFFDVGSGRAIPLVGVSVFHLLLFVHVVNAFAIITQAAAAAIAYDMWEDREFDRETQPGEVPPAPPPVATGSRTPP